MKFSQSDVYLKNVFGIKLTEYCTKIKNLPIDCAIAKFRNNEYPWKINHNFHEMFFILNGNCDIIFL